MPILRMRLAGAVLAAALAAARRARCSARPRAAEPVRDPGGHAADRRRRLPRHFRAASRCRSSRRWSTNRAASRAGRSIRGSGRPVQPASRGATDERRACEEAAGRFSAARSSRCATRWRRIVKAAGPVQYCFSPGIHPVANSYTFSSSISTDDLATAALRYFHGKHWNRVALITSTDASGQDAERAFVEASRRPENAGLSL